MDKILTSLTEDQLIEIKKKQLADMVSYLRDCERRVKGFGYFCLDEFATEMEMPHELKDHIKKALDEPDKEFIVNFKPNIIQL